MIVHLATFVWKEGTTPEQVAGVTAALNEMARELPELRFYLCGENLRFRANGADFGVLALLDDPAGLEAYLDSEAHSRVQREWLSTMTASRQAAQLSSDALAVTEDWLTRQ